MNFRLAAAMTALLLSSTGLATKPAVADVVNLNSSQDAWAYQFLNDQNFVAGFGGAYATYIAAGNGGPSSVHNLFTYLNFNVASTGLTASQITSATLHLYSIDPTPTHFGFPSNANNQLTINANAFAASPSWTANTVTYDTAPAILGGLPAGTASLGGINQWLDISITGLVQDWLSGAKANNGLQISTPTAIPSGQGGVVAMFDSSRYGGTTLVPYLSLTFNPVPEPSSMVLVTAGAAGLAVAGVWRRRFAKKLA